MSTRNPMNKRSQDQLQGKGTGMTRKSASSAKPARAAASSVRVVASSAKGRRKEAERGEDLSNLSKEERRARKQELRMREDRIFTASDTLLKQDYDYRRYRKIWWGLLILGVVAIAVVWLSMSLLEGKLPAETLSVVELVGIVISYAVIIGAFVFEFAKIRPLRNNYRSVAEGMSESKLNALIERGAAEDDRKRAEREAKKAAKKKKEQ
mgnify:CR=1 FL=1